MTPDQKNDHKTAIVLNLQLNKENMSSINIEKHEIQFGVLSIHQLEITRSIARARTKFEGGVFMALAC